MALNKLDSPFLQLYLHILEHELSNHHRRSPSISVAEIIFTATDCFIWRKHHHRNHNHWWMITQSELRTQNLELSHHILLGDY
ncbi:hypothetical protein P8452_12811 [Trifolium repens]|nr:hypothetical protein P8452_12811 [Trifolium repens]